MAISRNPTIHLYKPCFKMDLKEVEYEDVDWIDLVVMNLEVHNR
jgi:hypothetical protein